MTKRPYERQSASERGSVTEILKIDGKVVTIRTPATCDIQNVKKIEKALWDACFG